MAQHRWPGEVEVRRMLSGKDMRVYEVIEGMNDGGGQGMAYTPRNRRFTHFFMIPFLEARWRRDTEHLDFGRLSDGEPVMVSFL